MAEMGQYQTMPSLTDVCCRELGRREPEVRCGVKLMNARSVLHPANSANSANTATTAREVLQVENKISITCTL